MKTIRLFLFRILSKLAIWIFPNKERSAFLERNRSEQIKLHKRDLEMQSTVRPREPFPYRDPDLEQ